MSGEKSIFSTHIKAVADEEEIEKILNAVLDFMKNAREPMREFMEFITSFISGEKVGEEVAVFYKKLVDNGVPDDLAKQLTMRFLEKRLEPVPSISSLAKLLQGAGDLIFQGGRVSGEVGVKLLESASEMLRRYAEENPSYKRDVDEALEAIRRIIGKAIAVSNGESFER